MQIDPSEIMFAQGENPLCLCRDCEAVFQMWYRRPSCGPACGGSRIEDPNDKDMRALASIVSITAGAPAVVKMAVSDNAAHANMAGALLRGADEVRRAAGVDPQE